MSFVDDFFGFLFRYYSLGKGRFYGFYSTVFSISAVIILNVLFFEGLFLFQTVDKPSVLFSYSDKKKFIVPTMVIICSYLYFKRRFSLISKSYDSYSVQKKNIIRFWSLLYIIGSILSAILMLYSVRNNVRWFN